MDFGLNRRLCPNSSVLWQSVGRRAVLLQLDSKCCFSLDEVGSDFWRILISAQDVGSGLKQILDGYEVDVETLSRDIKQFCCILIELDLAHLEQA